MSPLSLLPEYSNEPLLSYLWTHKSILPVTSEALLPPPLPQVPGEHALGESVGLNPPSTAPGDALSGQGSGPPAEDYLHSSSPPTSAGSQVVPSLATLLRFTLPTLGIWLAGPIMSLVDTSVVGLRSSIELAAMGPATNVCDSMLVSRNQGLLVCQSKHWQIDHTSTIVKAPKVCLTSCAMDCVLIASDVSGVPSGPCALLSVCLHVPGGGHDQPAG